MHRVQWYLNAKSICHYANDAYSSYEVLHVIGLSQDYFLFLKDRKWEMEEGGIYRKRESRKKNGESAPRALGTGGSPFDFYALLQREYIPYFRRVLGERKKKSK